MAGHKNYIFFVITFKPNEIGLLYFTFIFLVERPSLSNITLELVTLTCYWCLLFNDGCHPASFFVLWQLLLLKSNWRQHIYFGMHDVYKAHFRMICFWVITGTMTHENTSSSFIFAQCQFAWMCRYKVISWLRMEQSNYCSEVEEIWETVDRGRKPRATVFKIFSTTERQWFDCSPSSLEITVLLPNCFKSPKHCP